MSNPPSSPSMQTRSKAKKDPPEMSSNLQTPGRTPATKQNKKTDGFQVTPDQTSNERPLSPKRKIAPKNSIATPIRLASPRINNLQKETETLKESEKPPEEIRVHSQAEGQMDTEEGDGNNSTLGNSSDNTRNFSDDNAKGSDLDEEEAEMAAEELRNHNEPKTKKKKKKRKGTKSKAKKKDEITEEDREEESSNKEREMEEENDNTGVDTSKDGNGGTNHQSYSEAAQTANDDDATILAENDKWKARRVKISIEIKEPKDKEQRLKLIYAEVNSILKIGRKAVTSLKMRRFTDMRIPKSDHAKRWISKFTLKDIEADDFCEYMAEGLKTWHPLERTKFYFRATLVMPEKSSMEKMLEKMGHYLPNTTKVSDSLSQLIHSPQRVGYLLRSNAKMTSSDEFITELNRIAHQYNPAVHFGISYSEMKNPNGQRATNWREAIKAVLLETNEGTYRDATDIVLKIFPGKRYPGHKRIWGMNLLFVYDCNHEDVDNLDIAQRNISTLINRQQVHSKYELMTSNNKILPKVLSHKVYKGSQETLRDILMNIKSTTTRECEGGQLFSAILYSDYNKKKEYWFFYHKKVKKEAEAVVRALPAMLKYEMTIAIDHFFYEGSLDDADEWDKDTRTLRNAITIATDNMLAGTEDLVGEEGEEVVEGEVEINEDQSIALNSMEQREFKRMTNLDDEETIQNPKAKKKLKPKTAKKSTATITPEVIVTVDDGGSLAGSSIGLNSATASLTPSKSKAFQKETLAETSKIVSQKINSNNAEVNKKLQAAEAETAKMQEYLALITAAMANSGINLPAFPGATQHSTATVGTKASNSGTQGSGEKSDEAEDNQASVHNPPNAPNIAYTGRSTSDDPNFAPPPYPLGFQSNPDDIDMNGGLDDNIAEEALEEEKRELRRLHRDQRRLEKEKARLLHEQQEKEYSNSEQSDNTSYTDSPSHRDESLLDDQGYVSANDGENSDADNHEYGEDEKSSDTSRSGSVSGYDDGSRGKSSSTNSSGSDSSSDTSSEEDSSSSNHSSNSDEDITKSVSTASNQARATGGDPGRHA